MGGGFWDVDVDAIMCLQIVSDVPVNGTLNRSHALGDDGQFGIDEAVFILQDVAQQPVP